jgi:hypothetical protein
VLEFEGGLVVQEDCYTLERASQLKIHVKSFLRNDLAVQKGPRSLKRMSQFKKDLIVEDVLIRS